MLRDHVLANLDEPIRESPELAASIPDLIASVKASGLEGLVGKRRDSRYEPGQRSGAWQKMRVNRGQPFVIAGYTVASWAFDSVVFGYYQDGKLLYSGLTRSGFTPASRDQLFRRFGGLGVAECPFPNLPEARGGRWGEGLTAEKMAQCRWLKPLLVGFFEFVEWDARRAPAARLLYGAARGPGAGRRDTRDLMIPALYSQLGRTTLCNRAGEIYAASGRLGRPSLLHGADGIK